MDQLPSLLWWIISVSFYCSVYLVFLDFHQDTSCAFHLKIHLLLVFSFVKSMLLEIWVMLFYLENEHGAIILYIQEMICWSFYAIRFSFLLLFFIFSLWFSILEKSGMTLLSVDSNDLGLTLDHWSWVEFPCWRTMEFIKYNCKEIHLRLNL